MDEQEKYVFILAQKKIKIEEEIEYFGFMLEKFKELSNLFNKLKT
ncbi:hypothetical protein [Sphingobacterium sp.]